MKNLVLMGVLSLLTMNALSAGDSVCKRCDEVKEWNKEHHKNYVYYEDYVNDPNKDHSVAPIARDPVKENKESSEK